MDITPPAGSRLAGYVARDGALAEGTLDPLEAALVRVRDPRAGGESVTWVALDALAVDVDLAREIARAIATASGVPTDSVVVCASHTHSGPSGWLRGIPFAAPEPGDPGLRADLVRRIAQAATGLAEDELAVRPVLDVGEADGVGTHRTDPALASDRSLGALAFIDEHGDVVGLVVDHASHATVLGHDNRRWSADWPGAARRALSSVLRGRTTNAVAPVVAFLQGAAGDASPRFVRRNQSPVEVERIGQLFAAQALAVVQAADEAGREALGEEPVVAVRRRQVEIRTRDMPDPTVLARRVAATEHAWRTAAEGGIGTAAERIARTRHEGAMSAAAVAETGLPPSFALPLSVVVVGHDAWLHLPVELFASHAVAIRAGSPFRQTRVIGYADGYFGYVPDAEAYRLETYEATSSLFDVAGAEVLVDAGITLLNETYDELWPRNDHA